MVMTVIAMGESMKIMRLRLLFAGLEPARVLGGLDVLTAH
jgi:hypothetical protein